METGGGENGGSTLVPDIFSMRRTSGGEKRETGTGREDDGSDARYGGDGNRGDVRDARYVADGAGDAGPGDAGDARIPPL